jgi:hypothetical protein
MHVAEENVAGRRSGIVGPEFVPFAEAVKEASACESWSRFCLEQLVKRVGTRQIIDE